MSKAPKRNEPSPQADAADESARQRKKYEEAERHLYTVLRFWTVCPDKPCRRARACRGDVRVCHRRWWPHVPEEIKIQLRTVITARNGGLSPQEAVRAAKMEVARYRDEQRRQDQADTSPAAIISTPATPEGAAQQATERERAAARVRIA
jgi:hypothetical protein